MIKIKLLAASVLAAGLLFGSQSAQAHCDFIEGPVAKAALAALDKRQRQPGAALRSGKGRNRDPGRVHAVAKGPRARA